MSKLFAHKLKDLRKWRPSADLEAILVLDAHTGGEPLRIVLDGLPEIKGNTILEKREYLKTHFDYYRKRLMWEPRGHADMYGAILTDPVLPDSDFGVIFLHNEGYSSMCGHGIIALTKAVIETGLVVAQSPLTTLKIDSPAGQIAAFARLQEGKVNSTYFHNVPSYVVLKDQIVEVPKLGSIPFDLAFGGAYYAFVEASAVGISIAPENSRRLIEAGMAIKQAVIEQFPFSHPFEPDLGFLYGTIFIGAGHWGGVHSQNVCIFANGEVDRSPTGTGVSARMALHHARGDVSLGDEIVIESIIGSKFTGSVIAETTFGGYPAVIPQVEGTAHICGFNTLLFDPKDHFKDGFFIR